VIYLLMSKLQAKKPAPAPAETFAGEARAGSR